jgi:hypothetical protein
MCPSIVRLSSSGGASPISRRQILTNHKEETIMAIKKTIDGSVEPSGTSTTLAGKAANEFRFDAGGVTHVSAKLMQGHKAVSKALPGNLASGGGFTLDRLVINLMIKDQSNKAVTDFTTPFELRIRYTPEDISAAGGKDKVKLAYWRGGKWVVFNQTDHKFKLEDTGFALVELSSWPSDPPIGIGH